MTGPSSVSEFDAGYFQRLTAARGHWWVVGMQLAAAALLEGDLRGGRLLDVGCGTGSNLAWASSLTPVRPLHALDLVPEAAAVSRSALGGTGVSSVAGSATALPYADACFDLVLSIDVLQHLGAADEQRALAEVRRVLVPGGRALLRTNAAFGRGRVPQRADWRLYTPQVLRSSIERADMQVLRLTSANMVQALAVSARTALLPPRVRPHQHQQDRHQTAAHTGHHGLGIPSPVSAGRNRILRGVLAAEATWLRRTGRPLPVGHTLLAVVQRRDEAQA